MKNLRIYLVLALICVGMVVFNSCSEDYLVAEDDKALLSETNVNENGTTFLYFIDNEEAEELNYAEASDDMFFLNIYIKNDDLKSTSSDTIIEKRAFTTEENYVAFGKTIGVDFETQLLFMSLMKSFAEETRAIEIHEKTGEIPSWYVEREKYVYDSLFIKDNGLKSAGNLFVTLYDKHYVPGGGAGKSVIMINTLPFMYPGWNDRVSCIEIVGLGGGVHIFGKSFYRQKLTTIINWGFTKINLPPSVDNKMRSGWVWF